MLDQVIAHAAVDHGLVKPPLALVELVVATTHPYTAPQKPRHLRLVGGAPGGTSTGPAEPAGRIRGGPDEDRPGTDPVRTIGSTVVNLPVAWSTPQASHPAAGSPLQQVQPQRCTLSTGTNACSTAASTSCLPRWSRSSRTGCELGEPSMVAVAEPRQQALRDALGDDESRVVFADMAELANPARIIPAMARVRRAHAGAPMRGVGEPIWAGRRAAEIAEAQFHEALMDVALAADTPLWVLCPYNISELDSAIIDEAYRSHASSSSRARVNRKFGLRRRCPCCCGLRFVSAGAGTAHRDRPVPRPNPDKAAADVLRFAAGAGLPTQPRGPTRDGRRRDHRSRAGGPGRRSASGCGARQPRWSARSLIAASSRTSWWVAADSPRPGQGSRDPAGQRTVRPRPGPIEYRRDDSAHAQLAVGIRR